MGAREDRAAACEHRWVRTSDPGVQVCDKCGISNQHPMITNPGTFRYVVTIKAATQDQANTVMAERLGFDEDYGFDYTIEGWE